MRFLILSLAAITWNAYSFASQAAFPSDWGIVRSGAYVIPSEGMPWTDDEGRAAGKRIGYLRVGTVVNVGDCRHVNGVGGTGGNYCDVQAENGVAGKTLSSLIFPIQRGHTYAVARQEVILFDRIQGTPRDKFSRNAGVIVEIVGDYQVKDPDALVHVDALYNHDREGGLTDLAVKKADLIAQTYVVEYPQHAEVPSKFSQLFNEDGHSVLRGGPIELWSYRPVTSNTSDQLAGQVSSALGWPKLATEDATELLTKAFDFVAGALDRILCVAEVDANAAAGFKLLGNGLGLSGKIPLLRPGRLFDIDIDVLLQDEEPQLWMVTAKTVICDMGATVADSAPSAVEAVTVIAIKGAPPSGAPVRLTAKMPPRFELRVAVAVDEHNNPKLFEVEGFLHYIKARELIHKQIAQSYIVDSFSRNEREAIAHALISKLGFFVRLSPDIDS